MINTIKEVPLNILTEIMSLKDKNIRYVEVYFYGGGDEGSVEEINLYTAREMNDDFTRTEFSEDDSPNLTTVLFNYFDELSNEYSTQHDWWNDDGGFGYFYLNLNTFEYKTEYSIYYKSVTNYTEEGHIDF